MALNYLKTRLKNRIDTAANWTSANPTLLKGEIGIESDTGYAKAGDGSTAWNNLGYLSAPGLTDCITTETLTETLDDYALKDDLSGYATLTGANSFTGANTFASHVRCNADLETASDNVLVTKGYVNEAIAGIDIDTSNLVDLSSTQTITGTKTFSGTLNSRGGVNFSSSSNVVVPTPTAAYHAATKKYVDDSVSGLRSLTTASVTIAASAWQNSQYTVSNDNITADSLVLMDAAVGISSTAFLALANAAIFCASQADGQLVLQAAGTVPTVDVTIVLAIF